MSGELIGLGDVLDVIHQVDRVDIVPGTHLQCVSDVNAGDFTEIGWISVEDGLPGEELREPNSLGINVFGFIPSWNCQHVSQHMERVTYWPGFDVPWTCDGKAVDVSHWQPLPPPPNIPTAP